MKIKLIKSYWYRKMEFYISIPINVLCFIQAQRHPQFSQETFFGSIVNEVNNPKAIPASSALNTFCLQKEINYTLCGCGGFYMYYTDLLTAADPLSEVDCKHFAEPISVWVKIKLKRQ